MAYQFFPYFSESGLERVKFKGAFRSVKEIERFVNNGIRERDVQKKGISRDGYILAKSSNKKSDVFVKQNDLSDIIPNSVWGEFKDVTVNGSTVSLYDYTNSSKMIRLVFSPDMTSYKEIVAEDVIETPKSSAAPARTERAENGWTNSPSETEEFAPAWDK